MRLMTANLETNHIHYFMTYRMHFQFYFSFNSKRSLSSYSDELMLLGVDVSIPFNIDFLQTISFLRAKLYIKVIQVLGNFCWEHGPTSELPTLLNPYLLTESCITPLFNISVFNINSFHAPNIALDSCMYIIPYFAFILQVYHVLLLLYFLLLFPFDIFFFHFTVV